MPNEFKVNNKDTSTTSNAAAAGWVSLLLTVNDHKTTCAPHMPSPTFMLARSLLHIQLCSGLYCGLAPLRATPDRSYAARLSSMWLLALAP